MTTALIPLYNGIVSKNDYILVTAVELHTSIQDTTVYFFPDLVSLAVPTIHYITLFTAHFFCWIYETAGVAS